jgi:hypothetical protein
MPGYIELSGQSEAIRNINQANAVEKLWERGQISPAGRKS